MFVEERPTETLPVGLAACPPGPELARMLSTVDRESLSGYDRVILMQAHHRLVSHFQAELCADMVAVADAETDAYSSDIAMDEIQDAAAWEIRAALTWTRRAAEYQLSFGSMLVRDYPQVWQALSEGRIDVPKARVICNQTLHLDDDTRARVADTALERASSQTTGQLRARIARLVITVDPESAKKRYEVGLDERRISSDANDDGTGNLYGLHLSPVDAQAAMRRINRLARAAKRADDPRTMDQIRADVFLDLLRGRNHAHHKTGRDRGVVDIHVDLATLTGMAENPGEISGWGPVISDIARQIVTEQSDSEHRVTVTDPDTGAIIWNGVTRRRPTAAQQRDVVAMNPTCVFPGCRMPAVDCDIDHHQAWIKGGPTQPWNNGPLCRHDHVGKHLGWELVQLRPGVYKWISPLGHTYTVNARPP